VTIPPAPATAPQWFAQWVVSLITLSAARDNFPVMLPEYAKANLPSASAWKGGQVNVTDEVGGYVPAFSDGTNWRRVTDRAIVS